MENKRGTERLVQIILLGAIFISFLVVMINIGVYNNLENLLSQKTINAYGSNGIINLFIEGDRMPPAIQITSPENTTYGVQRTELRYTYSDQNPGSCWYTLNNGVTNTSIVCGDYVTNITSQTGSNTWTVYGNDTGDYENSSSVTFEVVFPTTTTTSVSVGGGGFGLPVYQLTKTFKIDLDVFEKTVDVGETKQESIAIRNTVEMNSSIEILIDPALKEVLSINDKVELPPLGAVDVLVKLYGIKEGVYSGNIYFFGKKVTTRLVNETIYKDGFNITIANTRQVIETIVSNITYVLPARIIVKSKTEKMLDLDIDLEKNIISPGEELNFKVSVFNIGALRAYDFDLVYEIISKDEDITIANMLENQSIGTSLFLYKSMKILESVKLGEYKLKVTAFFGNLSVVEEAPFTISTGGLGFSPLLEGFRSGAYFALISFYLPIILAVVFLIIVFIILYYYFVYLRKRLFEKKIEELKKKSIYVFPDFKLLPKSKFAYIGQVADSGVKTYLDHTQLNRHTLIAGGTGSGKTIAGMVVVEEILKRSGCGVIAFDPTGQWTGFINKNDDKRMRSVYRKFSLSGSKSYPAKIIEIDERTMNLDILSYMKRGGLTIFKLDKLTPQKLDLFVGSCLEKIYKARLTESGSLKHLLVLDEVHRLLPKYGGRTAHIKLEQAVREFRKYLERKAKENIK